MPTVTVTKSDQSKNGKPRVYFDNRHGFSDAYYLGSKCAAPALGAVIEAQTTSKTFEDGKTIWFLNSWKPAQQAESTQVPEKTNGAQPARALVGWAIDAGDCSRLLSNVLASSIAAGLIKTPENLAPWVDRVYAYVNGVRTGKIVSFDDKLWPTDEPKTGLAGSIEDGEPPWTGEF